MKKKETPKAQLVSLTEENLVKVFLVNGLKNKNENDIKFSMDALLYAYPDKTKWKNEAFHLALLYNNCPLAIKLIEIGAKPNADTIKQNSVNLTSEQIRFLLDLLNK